jgi:hypothetical protein
MGRTRQNFELEGGNSYEAERRSVKAGWGEGEMAWPVERVVTFQAKNGGSIAPIGAHDAAGLVLAKRLIDMLERAP